MQSNEQTKMRRLEEHYEQDKKMLAKTEGPDIFSVGPETGMAYVLGSGEPVPLRKVAGYFADDLLKLIDGIVM